MTSLTFSEFRVVDLFTFPMVATGINKEGVTLMWLLQPFQVAWRCFDVAAQYFEEILLDLKTKKMIGIQEFPGQGTLES